MGKRKREDEGGEEQDYEEFCSGLQKESRDGTGDRSYIYSCSRRYKRPKINPNFYEPGEVRYRYLDPTESIYKEIKNLITNKTIIVDDIVEVNNSTLENAYDGKKQKKMEEYEGKVEEALLFHGTKEEKVGSICRFNFDWRLTGSNKGHKFGKGVCFSRNAKYASNYSDSTKHFKVMFVAKVLLGRVCRGHLDMSIPPKGYDTSQKGDNGVVLVKYEDNEFFPAYILYYHFWEPPEDRTQYYYHEFNNNRYGYHYYSRDSYSNDHHYNYRDSRHYSREDLSYDRSRPVRYNNHFFNSHEYSNNQASYDYTSDEHYDGSNHYYSFN